MDGPDGIHGYWRDLRQEPQYFSRRNFGGGSTMVWGGFSVAGTCDTVFTSSHMDSAEYQQVLDLSLVPYMEEINNEDREEMIYQQDRAGIHFSGSTMGWFERHGITVLDWPSRSPDLNPMENVWGWLVRQVYGNNRQYNTVEELQDSILHAWHSIDVGYLHNLVESMGNRIFQVIQRNGGAIDY